MSEVLGRPHLRTFADVQAYEARNIHELLRPTTVAAFDFDGTIAETFRPSPNGMGVNEACKAAIASAFGTAVAGVYDQQGGLKNRAPRELVADLASAIGTKKLVEHAQAYYRAHRTDFDARAIQPFDWDAGDGLIAATEVFVLAKLSLLTDQIGKIGNDGIVWPQLTPGFADFWKRLSADPTVTTVIISSGHNEFIRRVFEVHGLPEPKVLLTDDTVRFLDEPIYKPDPRLFELAMTGVRAAGGDPRSAVYFGDDPEKDGGLAYRSGATFFHFDQSDTKTDDGTFSHWDEVPWRPPQDPTRP